MFKKISILIIKGLLWLLDQDHRVTHTISSENDKKFTEIQTVDFQSDFGRATKVFQTVPYDIWLLRTETHSLTCADKHRVIRADGSCAWVEDLHVGDQIKTESGTEVVIEVRSLNIRTHTYCLEINTDEADDPNNHLYHTDGILSHNTTCAAGYLLWKAIFTDDITVLIVANNLNGALEIMSRVRYAYENLPDFIRPGALEYNKGSVTFDNKSRIVSRATGPDSSRGLSVALVYVDEFAFLRTADLARDFWTSVQPTLSTGGSCIITSTPKSDEDQFAQIWKDANNHTDEDGNPTYLPTGRNGFYPIKVTWDQHPDRDAAWEKKFRAQLGDARFRQEFCCEFVSDDDTLINSVVLSGMTHVDPEFFIPVGNHKVRFFKEPEPNKTYLVSLDPSGGDKGDPAALQVFELPGMVQVAEWNNNSLPTKGQVAVMKEVLHFIDDELQSYESQKGESSIYWTVETNNIGSSVLTIIEHTGEENFPGIFVSEKRKKGQKRLPKGLTTTAPNKKAACIRMKSLIESGRADIRSKELIRELKFFVSNSNSWAAKPGEHDDLVMATVLCVRMLDTVMNWDDSFSELREAISDDDTEYFGGPIPYIV